MRLSRAAHKLARECQNMADTPFNPPSLPGGVLTEEFQQIWTVLATLAAGFAKLAELEEKRHGR